jgi:hypothetical protein
MASWHLAVSDLPGRPFAVIDGEGAVAGCHATRASAVMQMTQLNMEGLSAADVAAIGEGASGGKVPDLKPGKKDSAPKSGTPGSGQPAIGKQVPWQAPPIAYTTPTTQTW